jgi:hypothetical protein
VASVEVPVTIMLKGSPQLSLFTYCTNGVVNGKIAYLLTKTMYNRLKSIGKYGIPINPSETYKRLHKNKFKAYKIASLYLFPLGDTQTCKAMNFSQEICNYTKEGRSKLHQNLKADFAIEINKMLQQSLTYCY